MHKDFQDLDKTELQNLLKGSKVSMMIADAPFGLHKHGEGGSWDSTDEAWTEKEFRALLGLAQVGFEFLLQ